MREPLVLTFDVGTQSMRAMLVNQKGDIVAFEQFKYERPYFSTNSGWAEQKPNFYFEVLCDTSRNLRKNNEELFKDIIAVTVTTVRDTVLCLDEDKKPLRDIILWLDKREAKKLKPIPKLYLLAFKAVKMEETVKMQQKMSVCNWIMENEPEIWEKTDKFVLLSTYLNYQLTNNLIDSIASVIGHLPVDYKKRCWLKDNGVTRCIADVPKEKLVETVEAGDIIGTITKKTAEISGIPEGLPLIATGSDKSCETLGLSVIDKHQAALSFGTTATIQFTTKKYFEPEPFAPSYPAVPDKMYNAEVQIYRGYWMLSWFKKEFAAKECEEARRLGVSAEELLNKRLREIPAGSDGLLLQPFWSPGVVTPNARGAIIGFSDIHTRLHIYRAIIEGIGFALMDGMYQMERRSGMKIEELFVGGGGSQSDEICQITANMFGLPVKRIQTHEASGIGSSMVAFITKGIFSSYKEGIENMCHTKDVFIPDEKEHELYCSLYKEVYCEVFNKLEPLYKRLKRLIRRDKNES